MHTHTTEVPYDTEWWMNNKHFTLRSQCASTNVTFPWTYNNA